MGIPKILYLVKLGVFPPLRHRSRWNLIQMSILLPAKFRPDWCLGGCGSLKYSKVGQFPVSYATEARWCTDQFEIWRGRAPLVHYHMPNSPSWWRNGKGASCIPKLVKFEVYGPRRNIWHFNRTEYYLFDVNCTSFNKIYSLISQMWKFKNYRFDSQVATTANWSTFLLIAVGQVTN